MADMMKEVVRYVEPHLARNGGPIIMTQIENEYGRYNEYVQWCGNLTQQLNTDTVWIMCQQPTPPAPIIPTCNGDDCSGYVQAQQTNGLPAMWTEDWVAWFQHWGESVPTRDTRNIAYDVASFFAKGGSYQNYYVSSLHSSQHISQLASTTVISWVAMLVVTSQSHSAHRSSLPLIFSVCRCGMVGPTSAAL